MSFIEISRCYDGKKMGMVAKSSRPDRWSAVFPGSMFCLDEGPDGQPGERSIAAAARPADAVDSVDNHNRHETAPVMPRSTSIKNPID
jgi:hypothetical protein